MTLLPILERLRAECGGDFATIEAASELSPLPRAAYPTASVHPLAESPQPNQTIGAVYQLVDVELGVLIAAPADHELSGAAPLDSARARVRAALLGYRQPDWYAPLTWARGELVALNAGAVLWRDVYSTTVLVTASLSS